ncbi:MAG: amidohydrolase family protein [Clostridiales bacterium]|nr:amidohydrolase family protein [Clostridiales bacterium]
MNSFILKGNIFYSLDPTHIEIVEGGYAVCIDGISAGVFREFPNHLRFPLFDLGDWLILPGLIDLHTHAPQYAFRGLGTDLELLDWLNAHTFPEESLYKDLEYAEKAYRQFAAALKKSPNTRACIFSTIHVPATLILMDELDRAGIAAMVGKVNMDRNSPDGLREESAAASLEETRKWISACQGKYRRIKPIITPRFIPTCSDELMAGLGALMKEFSLPAQSHLSENLEEQQWVRELCPQSEFYGDAYDSFGVFGSRTIMAHCVWSDEKETELIKNRGVYVAHCPQSNENLASGIAPIRRYLDEGIHVGLGSDIAGGCHLSIFRAMTDAMQASNLRWRLLDESLKPLTIEEAFYMGTKGGGEFFGKAGSLEQGYEFDAIAIDDSDIEAPRSLSALERLKRAVYCSNDMNIKAKFVAGVPLDGFFDINALKKGFA